MKIKCMSKAHILILILIFLYIIFGSAISILHKYLDIEESRGKTFDHDAFLNLLMFLAETLGLVLYCIIKLIKRIISKSEIIEGVSERKCFKIKKIMTLGLPCIFDTFASFLSNLSLSIFPGSIYTMLKGYFIILFTYFLSQCFIKCKRVWDHIIGIIVAFVAILFLGFPVLFEELKEKKENFDFLNIIIAGASLIVAMFIQSLQFIYEEFMMMKYELDPLLFIGCEGLFGFIFNFLLCIIFYVVKCGKNPINPFKDFCTQDEDGIWRIENIFFAFKQISDSGRIIGFLIGLFVVLAFCNIIGIHINKYGGAITRSLIENFKSVIVYIYFLVIPAEDKLKESFNIVRLFGIPLIFLSIFIFFGFLKIDEKCEISKKIKTLTSSLPDDDERILNESRESNLENTEEESNN